jgi:hypothetical protein
MAGFGVSGSGGQGFAIKLEADGDAKIGNSADDVIQITGSLKVDGGAIFNEGSIAANFRVEGNNSENIFFIDGTNDRIGIDTASPAALLHISSSTTGVIFRIDHPDSGVDNPIFFVTGSSGNSRVGIGTETPDATFAISDNGKVFEVGSAAEGSWFEVNNGTVYLNLGGGISIAGGTNLGQRFNIAPINGTYGALGIGKYPGSTVNIVEVNSANSDEGGDFFVIKSDGKVGIATTTPSVALDVDGSVHCQGQFARGTATKDLGSGTTSTIAPSSLGAGTVLITASGVTTPTSGPTETMHVCTIADGTTAGELLTLVLVTTALDGTGGAASVGAILFAPTNPLNPSEITTVVGAAANGGTSPIGSTAQYIWTGSKWARLSVNGSAA